MEARKAAEIESLIGLIREGAETRYMKAWEATLPKVEELCRLYLSLDSEGRNYILARTTVDMASMFRGVANLCAVDCVRQRDPDRIFLGIVALVIENLSFDFRDTTIALAVLYNSALKIDINWDEILGRALTICTPEMGRFLIDFSKRSESEKSLKAFSVEEIEGKDGFDYRSIPWPPLIPDSRTSDSVVSSSPPRPQAAGAESFFRALLKMLRRLWSH